MIWYEFHPTAHPSFYDAFLCGEGKRDRVGYTRNPVTYGNGRRPRLIFVRSSK